MINSIELEKQLIAGIIQYPDKYFEIERFISGEDFYTGEKNEDMLHRSIFSIASSCIKEAGTADEVVIATRAKELGISSKLNISVYDYIQSLSLKSVNPNKVVSIAKELKKYTVKRGIFETCRRVAMDMKKMSPDATFEEIVRSADESFNSQINLYDSEDTTPENIFEKMEEMVEERGNNPIKIRGLVGPYKKINEIYGSLFRPGNITTVVARSGFGKSTLMGDLCLKTSELNGDIPILHLDNGEMSEEETIMRQCSALSGVPLHLLESGNWRKAGEEVVEQVRAVWKKIKDKTTHEIKPKFYYYNVAGMSVDQMLNLTKRFYYNKVGRGNQMILAFDYLKTTGQQQKGMSEWAVVGEIVDKFKQLIHKEIVFDKEPVISMMTAVQANRTGITTNKSSDNIIDDESIVSLSDRIIQFCSHLFILRKKTADEIARDGREFGTHKVIFVKYRHLGEDIEGALEPVIIDDKPQANAIHFTVKNFSFVECGDSRDLKRKLEATIEFTEEDFNEPSRLPI